MQLGSRISPELLSNLRHLAIDRGTSVTELVNEALIAVYGPDGRGRQNPDRPQAGKPKRRAKKAA